VKFFWVDPVQDILFPPDRKFVFVRNKKKPCLGYFYSPRPTLPRILTNRKLYLGNQSVRLFLFLCDSTSHLEMIFFFTEKIYSPHLNHHYTTIMSNLDKTFKEQAVSKVTKYNKRLKKNKALAKRALEEDWKGPGFDIKFTSFEAVGAMRKKTSQAQLINQACNAAKNLQEEKWVLKVALAHNYYI